jgi:hypothetical protein
VNPAAAVKSSTTAGGPHAAATARMPAATLRECRHGYACKQEYEEWLRKDGEWLGHTKALRNY